MTICSYNNSGQIKYDVDIEMAQGYWNTSASRLWTKIRDNFHDELVAMYAKMRANGLSYESLMSYFYGQQISKIPETYYNKDADTKYLPFATQYMGMAHGNGYEHLKRWLKNRLIFTDTLYDYAPSYNNDVLTIRANTTEPMTITIETYTPVYQHLSWYNNQMDKKKIDGKTAITFTGTAQAATDQEVLIYGGSNIKRITGISSMNPNSMLIGSATRLIELDISNCPILATVNATGSNFTPHTYLNKLDISNCPNLTGTLRINNSPLLRELNAKGTGIDTLQLAPSLRNLEVLRLPNTVTELTLNDAGLLNTLEFDEGANLQRISLSNCPGIANSNINLTKVPTVSLDNSLDKEELYLSEVTDLTLKNMPTLKRVLFTPNNEYEEFDINNVINGKNYKVTTFNNPNMKEFITTAPHRASYNNSDFKLVDKEIITDELDINNQTILAENYNANLKTFSYAIDTFDFDTQLIEAKLSLANCTGANENIISFGETINTFASNTIHLYYTSSNNTFTINYQGNSYKRTYTPSNTDIVIKLNKKGLFIEDNIILNSTEIANILTLTSINIGSQEGGVRSKAVYEYIKYASYATAIVQVKDYGDIKPNTTFIANSLDLSNTQFTDIKFLCTTDLYNLKVPTTMKNFYCDSAMDIDTEVVTEASYGVIHDELVEPYTTNYEGNVYRKREELIYLKYQGNIGETLTDNKMIDSTKTIVDNNEYATSTDLIYIDDAVNSITFFSDGQGSIRMLEYNENQEATVFTGNNEFTGNLTIPLDSTTKYIRVCYRKLPTKASNLWIEVPTVYTPNIIPSSASGSLIFNLYSNNTTQPTSTSPYMWDLTGLKLNDFYTFGMNNNVKTNEDAKSTYGIDKMYGAYRYYISGSVGSTVKLDTSSSGNGSLLSPIKVSKGDKVKISLGCSFKYTIIDKSNKIIQAEADSYSSNNSTISIDYDNAYALFISNHPGTAIGDFVYINDIKYAVTSGDGSDVLTSIVDLNNVSVKFDNITSITMPQRLPGYSIRMVNADITPNNYANHLYPLLVDTTLPITGKLDYSKYKGTSLAWAYAYTTNDVAITPLDSRHIGGITNEYNKLYGTDYVDIVDVWAYKDDDFSNKTTNEAITKAYIELTSSNYTTRIDEVLQWYPNCTDLYLFEDGSVTNLREMFFNGNTNVRNQILKVEFIEGYFTGVTDMTRTFQNCSSLTIVPTIPNSVTNIDSTFRGCSSLTTVPNIPDSVTKMSSTFNGCSSLTTIPTIPNSVTNMDSTFNGCSALTTTPNIPDSVTNMNNTFSGCSALTTAPNIPNGVTTLRGTFDGCTSLTTIPNIPSACSDYYHFAYGCSNLTSVPIDGWKGFLFETFKNCSSLNQQINISDGDRFTLNNTFCGCSSLSITPTLPSAINGNEMNYCFKGCTSLTTPPTIPNGVTHMNNTFDGCTSLTTAPVIPNSVTNMKNTFYGCTSLIEGAILHENITNIQTTYSGCTSLKKVYIPLSANWVSLNRPLNDCRSLEEVIWVGNRNTSYDVFDLINSNYNLLPRQSINDLVPEHLGTVESATLTLGETYGAYLSPDEVFLANRKGWTIEGASNDFTIVNASDDVSGLTRDENITSCIIELTSSNYKTRIDEVLQWYPNCTELYLFEDGSVTSLFTMFYANNTSTRKHIVKVEFLDGYFLGLTDISYAFLGCFSLTTVTNIPDSVTNMKNTFNGCASLITVPSIPGGVTNMESTFFGCSRLTTVPNIPNGVTDMYETFKDCTSLTTAPTIPDSVTNMYNTFTGCTSLTTVPNIPNSVTNMQNTFQNCKALTTAPTIPDSVTNMGNTFYGCTSLTTVPNIGNSVTSMNSTFQGCTSLTTAPTIPDSVTNMYNTFYGCTSLTTAPNIPNGVTTMYSTFKDCTKLIECSIPLTNVTDYAQCLLNCSALTNITWVGERTTNFSLATLGAPLYTQADIQELVPEHLGTVTSATLTLGETYLAYLTEEEKASAVAKGWTLQ